MKSIFTSKTFWMGVLTFLTGAATLSKNPTAITAAALLNDPAVQAQVGMVVSGITGIVLRYKTDQPVKVLP
jgi:hypothetical protein